MSFLELLIKSCQPQESQDPGVFTETGIPVPFISTDLDIRNFDWLNGHAQDFLSDGKAFRRLDPAYRAWLYHRMETARKAHALGKVPDQQWRLTRERFDFIDGLAIEQFGEVTLRDALKSFDSKTYKPPRTLPRKIDDWLYPTHPVFGESECIHPVSRNAVEKVNAIRDCAYGCGWTEAQLYQNRGRFKFPCGQDYGLVCSVEGDRFIGRVSERFIEIILNLNATRPAILHFQCMTPTKGFN